MPYHLFHPQLGSIHGCRVTQDLVQFRSVPYAQVPRRFARSEFLNRLPSINEDEVSYYDASKYGPCSIQPSDSIEIDLRWNQLPPTPRREQSQSEDCLRVTLTCPVSALAAGCADLPVIVFVHGGALMTGSGTSDPKKAMRSDLYTDLSTVGDRRYYDPVKFCTDALICSKPIVFAAINYRLGALGFLHCPEAADLLPANNGYALPAAKFLEIVLIIPASRGGHSHSSECSLAIYDYFADYVVVFTTKFLHSNGSRPISRVSEAIQIMLLPLDSPLGQQAFRYIIHALGARRCMKKQLFSQVRLQSLSQ